MGWLSSLRAEVGLCEILFLSERDMSLAAFNCLLNFLTALTARQASRTA